MITVAFVVLAIIWAAVLIPPLVRQRAEVRPADSIVDFRNRLGILQRTTPVTVQPVNRLQSSPTGPLTPAVDTTAVTRAKRREAQRRRRDILVTLAGTSAATLVIGLIPAFSSLLWIHVLSDALLVTYVALLVQMRKRAQERAQKLHYLPQERSSHTQYSSMPDGGGITVIAQSQ